MYLFIRTFDNHKPTDATVSNAQPRLLRIKPLKISVYSSFSSRFLMPPITVDNGRKAIDGDSHSRVRRPIHRGKTKCVEAKQCGLRVFNSLCPILPADEECNGTLPFNADRAHCRHSQALIRNDNSINGDLTSTGAGAWLVISIVLPVNSITSFSVPTRSAP